MKTITTETVLRLERAAGTHIVVPSGRATLSSPAGPQAASASCAVAPEGCSNAAGGPDYLPAGRA